MYYPEFEINIPFIISCNKDLNLPHVYLWHTDDKDKQTNTDVIRGYP